MSLRRLSIQSKLILVLLVVSLSAVVVVSYASYRTARQAAYEAVERQLISLRVTKANLIQVMLGNFRDQITSFATSRTALESLSLFTDALDELGRQPLKPEETRQLEAFYRDTFLPGLAAKADIRPQLNMVMPADAAGQRLQHLYIARNPHPYEQGQKLEAAADDSKYSQLHKRFHGVYAQIAKRVGLEDIVLVEAEGLRTRLHLPEDRRTRHQPRHWPLCQLEPRAISPSCAQGGRPLGFPRG